MARVGVRVGVRIGIGVGIGVRVRVRASREVFYVNDRGIEPGLTVVRLGEGTARPTRPKRYKRLRGSHGQLRGSVLIRKGVMYECPGVIVDRM